MDGLLNMNYFQILKFLMNMLIQTTFLMAEYGQTIGLLGLQLVTTLDKKL